MTPDPSRVQEAINAAIVRVALDCIVVIDQDGRVTQWNAAAEQTFGYASHEALGRSLNDLTIPPASRAAHTQGLGRYLATGEARVIGQRVQVEAQRRDGTLFPCELAIHPVTVDGATYFVAYLRDITERTRAIAAAKEGDARYRALVERAGVGVVRAAPDGRILEANATARRILGYTSEELQQRTVTDITHPDDNTSGQQAAFEQLMNGELDNLALEKRYVRKDGGIVWANVTASIVKDETGRVLYDVAIIEDITERKRVEQERARLARGIEESTDFIAFADLDNHIVYLNEAGRRLIGFDGPITEGLSVPDFVHPDDRRHLLEEAWPTIRATGRWEGEMRFVHCRTHEVIPVHRTIFALTDPVSGERYGYATVTRDIRERKRAEAERLAWQAELERQVTERTRELQEANAELDAFSYSISHDLRAPIRHISGFARMLRTALGDDIPPLAEKYLAVIEGSAVRMNTLVNALLQFARHARDPLHVTRADLTQLVRDVQEELTLDVQDRQVTWHVGELPTVDGDPAMLRQVLLNVLSNAVKYTRTRPHAVIRVWAERHGDEWVVHIQDNGVGFDPRYAGKLFGVFQRLHRADEFEGVGIGLANAQRIIGRHGGRLWATSVPNEGATFSFSLRDALTQQAEPRT